MKWWLPERYHAQKSKQLSWSFFFFLVIAWMLNKCIKSIHALLFLTYKNWKKNLFKTPVVTKKFQRSNFQYLNKLQRVSIIFARWQLVMMCTKPNCSMSCTVTHQRLLTYIFKRGHLRSRFMGTVLVRIIILKADKHSLSYEWHLESKRSKNTMTAVQ